MWSGSVVRRRACGACVARASAGVAGAAIVVLMRGRGPGGCGHWTERQAAKAAMHRAAHKSVQREAVDGRARLPLPTSGGERVGAQSSLLGALAGCSACARPSHCARCTPFRIGPVPGPRLSTDRQTDSDGSKSVGWMYRAGLLPLLAARGYAQHSHTTASAPMAIAVTHDSRSLPLSANTWQKGAPLIARGATVLATSVAAGAAGPRWNQLSRWAL